MSRIVAISLLLAFLAPTRAPAQTCFPGGAATMHSRVCSGVVCVRFQGTGRIDSWVSYTPLWFPQPYMIWVIGPVAPAPILIPTSVGVCDDLSSALVLYVAPETAYMGSTTNPTLWLYIPYVPELVGLEIYSQFFAPRATFSNPEASGPPLQTSAVLKFAITM